MRPTDNLQRRGSPLGYHPNPRGPTGPHLSLNTSQALPYQNHHHQHHLPQRPPPGFSFTQSTLDASSTAFVAPAGINGQCPPLCSNGYSPSSLHPATPIAMSPSPQFDTASEAHSPARSNASYDPAVSPGPKRTGRPADWIPEKCRQLARAYVYTHIPLQRLIQLFSIEEQQPLNNEEAESKKAAAQKRLNQMLGRDNRPLRPKDYEQAMRRVSVRLHAAERTQSYKRRHGGPVPQPQRRETIVETVERTLTNMSSKSVRLFKRTREMTINTLHGSRNPSPIQRAVTAGVPASPCAVDGLVLVPGDLLKLDTQNTDTRGCDENERSISYRAVALELASCSQYLWVGTNGPTEMAKLLEISHNVTIPTEKDLFGHTILHFLAARPDKQEVLISVVRSGLTPSFLAAKNTAGQTFLHTLSADWFQLWEGTNCYFFQLIGEMTIIFPELVPQLLSARDMYGRTVLHVILDLVETPGTALDITTTTILNSGCDQSVALYRDTFSSQAVKPPPDGLPEHYIADVLTLGLGYETVRNHVPFPSSPANKQFTERERFIHIINRTQIDPFVEDEHGRGPLHCLAELSREDPNKSVKKGRKRKASDATSPISAVSPHADDDPQHDLYYLRVEPVNHLLRARCSPSAYNKAGNTALMAFVDALPDREAKRLEPVLEAVINAARVEGMVDARNRAGETALMVAARGGKKTAFRLLLAAGANWHVRNTDGKGLLEVLIDNIGRNKADLERFAPLEACCSMLTKDERETGVGPVDEVVMRPDVLDEWGLAARGA